MSSCLWTYRAETATKRRQLVFDAYSQLLHPHRLEIRIDVLDGRGELDWGTRACRPDTPEGSRGC